MEQDFDIFKTLEDTKENLQNNITVNQGRIAMIDELIQYFKANNLKVIKETVVNEDNSETNK